MRIMLACNAGMSTSLVVAKMQDAAKAHGKDYKIWAVGDQAVVDVIDGPSYGRCDGAAVLKQAEDLYAGK